MARRPRTRTPSAAPNDDDSSQVAAAEGDAFVERTQAEDASNATAQEADNARIEAEEGETIEELPDGGVAIHTPGRARREPRHFENLVENDDLQPAIATLCLRLKQEIENDIEGQKKATEKYAESIEATGQTGKAPGGARFEGASTVTHPIMGEIAADYTARVCREMLPPGGPAKPHVEGAMTKERYERAKRVARYMNVLTRKKIRNFRSEMEQAFAQQPFAGASYLKIWRDRRRIRVAFVPYERVHRPANNDDFYNSERITHELTKSKREYTADMRAGLYVEHEFGLGTDTDTSKAQRVADKVTGVVDTGENLDDDRTFYECSCYADIEGETKPYIVTLDKETGFALSCRRNWEKNDEDCERLDFLYEFGFWPFREGKPIGLAHMVAGVPKATTGALRALLDSALANNFPGATKLKGGQSGSTTMPSPGELKELENATQTDDIRKLVLPTEYNPPSAVLFQLLGFLVEAARGVVRTTFDDIVGKGRQDIPVGTMMMLVDEGTVVYSSIFARQHAAMERLLAGMYRLCYDVVADEDTFADREGSERVTKADFEGDAVVVPSSDPRVNSVTQRWTRANFLAARANDPATAAFYNRFEVEKRLLEVAEIEGIDAILVKPPTPVEMAAVNENVAASLGRPITAFPEQDHLAHLEVHADFVMSPMFGAHAAFTPSIAPAMLQHFKEHMAMHYAKKTMDIVDATIERLAPGENVREFKELFNAADTDAEKLSVVDMMRVKDPDLGRQVDRLFAVASKLVLDSVSKDFVKIAPMLASMQQVAEKFKPPMPMDPTQAAVQTATIAAQTQQGITMAREKGQVERQQAQLQHDATEGEKDRALKAAIAQEQIAAKTLDTHTKHQMNTEDNVTALTIMEHELASGEKVAVSTGTGVNPGAS